MDRSLRLAHVLVRRHAATSAASDADSDPLQDLVLRLRGEYPGLKLYAYEADNKIELQTIAVANKGQGTGTKVIRALQEYARQVHKPIVLRPEPEPRKKKALFDFYKNLGFVKNTGRYLDYTISSPFALTMYWKP